MADELRKGLMQILSSSEGLHAIIITDRDGVPILKVNTESVPELALRMNFLSTFANATEQASKLGMGKNNRIISIYQNYQVIQLNKMPVVITLIARNNANTGYLLTLEDTLEPLVQALCGEVASE
ncbi:unnamed protein product [Allacma fusca]|uniref:Uncharacterized protein n=1 Tax=Allacma fusca TaxID=39272 RepID=A0A8J2NP54_9HEXA|nr:unnamed protein product [Allacma fusca]